MDTLTELITREVGARGETLTAFAHRIGSNRQTIRGWQTSLPAPAMLHRVADALNIPYPTVLTASLHSAGYIDDPADVLANQTIHVIARCDGSDYDDRGEFSAVAAFTNAIRAEDFLDVSNAVVDGAEFALAHIEIDTTEPPSSVRIHTHSWSHRADRITESSTLEADIPTRLANRTVSDIEGLELTDTGAIYRLRVDSLDPQVGRETLQKAVTKLRAEGRLLPPDVEIPHGRFSGLTEWALEEAALSGLDPTAVMGIGSHAYQWRSSAEAMAAMQTGLKLPPTPRPNYPIDPSQARAGDVAVLADNSAAFVCGPGHVIDPSGKPLPMSDLAANPGIAGIFRPETAETVEPQASVSRRRRVVIATSSHRDGRD